MAQFPERRGYDSTAGFVRDLVELKRHGCTIGAFSGGQQAIPVPPVLGGHQKERPGNARQWRSP